MSAMFTNAHVFNQDISSWDVSGVYYGMYGMFEGAFALINQDISNGMYRMCFMLRCLMMLLDISEWDVSNVVYMRNLFAEQKFLTKIYQNGMYRM